MLLLLFARVGWHHLGSIHRGAAALAAAVILTVGSGAAILATEFPENPAALATPIATQSGAIYLNAAVITATGIFYESIEQERYAIKQWDGSKFETLPAEGHALHPSAPDSGARIYFELVSGGSSSIAFFDTRSHLYGVVAVDHPDPHEPAVSHDGGTLAFVSHEEVYLFDGQSCRGLKTPALARNPSFVPGDRDLVYVAGEPSHSRIMRMDLRTGENKVLVDRKMELANPSISPDHSMLLYASRDIGGWQIWTGGLASNRQIQVTKGRCNSLAPAWALDSSAIVFASDCNRGLNLPALFRMPVDALDAGSPSTSRYDTLE
jgi:hypothetical protein